MTRKHALLAPATLSFALLLAGNRAHAINGSQPGGYGVKNAAMGGASIALPLDAEAAANNPAGMAFVPKSATLGADIFKGESSTDYYLPGNHLENNTTIAVPTGGLAWPLDEQWTLGVSAAAQGVGADYGQPALPVPGAANAKSSLKVAEIIPSVAWKPRPDLAVGAALNLVYQRFDVSGVIVPAPVPGGFQPVPEHGTQSASGAGVRFGLLWKISPDLAVGANYKSHTHMGKLGGYADDVLAYSEGRLDVPAQYGLGIAWNVSEQVTIASDWLRIKYAGISAMQDPMGFGWQDQPVFRLGGAWAFDDALTLRAGISRNKCQIEPSRLAQNVLVPSIFNRAYTTGISWRESKTSEFNAALEFNPRRTLSGTESSTGVSLSAKAYFVYLGYQYSW
jgi:long-chain fatty acid transport protein